MASFVTAADDEPLRAVLLCLDEMDQETSLKGMACWSLLKDAAAAPCWLEPPSHPFTPPAPRGKETDSPPDDIAVDSLRALLYTGRYRNVLDGALVKDLGERDAAKPGSIGSYLAGCHVGDLVHR
jgi:hypothetical protein